MPGQRVAVVTAGGRGGGYLRLPRAGLACVPCRPGEPRPTHAHVSDRALPNCGVGRSCQTLRALRAPAHLLQLPPQPALSEVPGGRLPKWLADHQAEPPPCPRLYFHVVFTLPRPIADIAYQNKAVVYDLLLKTAAETLITIAAESRHLNEGGGSMDRIMELIQSMAAVAAGTFRASRFRQLG